MSEYATESDIRELMQALSELNKIFKSDAFKERMDIIKTHNKIIDSLSEAEKGHANTLNSFLEELQKRVVKINELNSGLAHTNTIANQFNSRLNDYINMVNASDARLTQHDQELKGWIKQAGGRLEFAAFDGVEKILRKFKRHMFINTACNTLILLLLSIFLYAVCKRY